MKHMGKRYRAYLDAAPSWLEGRRALIAYARAHGAAAAARMSGSHLCTVYDLINAAKSGRLGRKRWSPSDKREAEERIIAARRAHPDYGPKRLKKYCGIPHGTRKIGHVIREHGLLQPQRPKYDPAFRLANAERRAGYARMAVRVEELAAVIAADHLARFGKTGIRPLIAHARKRLEKSERVARHWRKRLGTAKSAKSVRPFGDQRRAPDPKGQTNVGRCRVRLARPAKDAKDGGLPSERLRLNLEA